MTDISVGRADFVRRYGLATEPRDHLAKEVIEKVTADRVEIVRLCFVDQHGVLRGKTLPANALANAMRDGCTITSTLLLKDTAHRTVFPVWQSAEILGAQELSGAGDLIMIPDPGTYKQLPWSPHTGWILCDLYLPSGPAFTLSTRRLLANAVDQLHERKLGYQVGLEVEFHVFKLEDEKLQPARSGQPPDPPEVSLTTHGYQYLTEFRADEMEPVTDLIRRAAIGLQLPLRSIEVEFGPSQYEFTFAPGEAMAQADAMVLFRSAVKQICHRHGLHATFMCKPALPNVFASGWHLHQSLVDAEDGTNLFMPNNVDELLSPTGRYFVAGLLEHANEAMVLSTPSVNGYKRYQPYTMAPDRILWSADNKGAMVRVIGGVEDRATRIENRVGEPAANPYLYIAGQLISGLSGIDAGVEPPAPSLTPYEAEAPKLPSDLGAATQAFKNSELFRKHFGDTFVDYLASLKEAEFSRFMQSVTDWEHREYFSSF
jgi:glutamine synthetase